MIPTISAARAPLNPELPTEVIRKSFLRAPDPAPALIRPEVKHRREANTNDDDPKGQQIGEIPSGNGTSGRSAVGIEVIGVDRVDEFAELLHDIITLDLSVSFRGLLRCNPGDLENTLVHKDRTWDAQSNSDGI